MSAERFRCILFDWGGTLMSEDGPLDIPMARWPRVAAIDGAKEALAALAPRYRLALATNASVSCRADIEAALQRVDLAQHFADIFCFTEIGGRKDAPQFWTHVCSALASPASALVMVGDSIEQDAIAPRQYGVFSIWFNEGGRMRADEEGIPTIQRFGDLIALLGNAA